MTPNFFFYIKNRNTYSFIYQMKCEFWINEAWENCVNASQRNNFCGFRRRTAKRRMHQKFRDWVWTMSPRTVPREPKLLSHLLPLQKMQILWVDPVSTNVDKIIVAETGLRFLMWSSVESLLKLNTEVKKHFLHNPSQRFTVHPELQRSDHVQVWM